MSKSGNTSLKIKAMATVLALSVSATSVFTIRLHSYASNVIDFETMTEEELVITGIEDAVYTGREVKQDLTIKYQGETLRENVDYECIYTANVNAGEASILIRGLGDYEGSRIVHFTIEKATPDYGIVGQITGTYGECLRDIVLPKRDNGEFEWWEDTNTVPQEAGEHNYHLKFSPYDQDNYNEVEKFMVTVLVEPKNISDGDVEISGIQDAVYCQSPITYEPTLSIGERILEKDRDYTITFDNNVNSGTAICTIEGIGNYTGKVQKTFNILKADPDYGTMETLQAVYRDCLGDIKLPQRDNGTFLWEYNQSISVGSVGVNSSFALRFVPQDKANYNIIKDIQVDIQVSKKDISSVTFPEMKLKTYTGDELLQNVYLKDGEIKLVKDKDYVVTYKDNVNAGVGSVIIKGVDNYKGEKTLKFTIEKATPKFTKPATLSAVYGQTLSQVVLPQCDNGTFYFEQADDTVVGDVGVNSFSLKFIPLDTDNFISIEEIPVKIKVEPLDLSNAQVIGVERAYKATGKEVRPAIKVINNQSELVKNNDFSVGYANNIYPGKAAVVVKGCNNYTGKIIMFYQVE